jgi:hypothetical protein
LYEVPPRENATREPSLKWVPLFFAALVGGSFLVGWFLV